MNCSTIRRMSIFHFVGSLLLNGLLHSHASVYNLPFVVKETPYTRLCGTKNILTVNGKFPGPTLHFYKGDIAIMQVFNQGKENITIHWHGVKQLRYPWTDGPEYVTQCPIKPGANFTQKIVLSTEEGTLWWHAHSDWSRATVHGAIIVYPKMGTTYPFPRPYAEVPIILGEWWKKDIKEVLYEFLQNGGAPVVSDAFTINGQPGDLSPCSKSGTFKLEVKYGKTYLLRIINVGMSNILFFSVANHQLMVVGTDGSYTKPLKSDYLAISPGQTIDVLLEANQKPDHYYMAARAYSSADDIAYDGATATAVARYAGRYTPSPLPLSPYLPDYNDTNASVSFTGSLRSLATKNHPIDIPVGKITEFLFTLSINAFPCANHSCEGPNDTRLAASMNNISFVLPSNVDILRAYYNHITGVYGDGFPSFPPLVFNYTAYYLPQELELSRKGTEVKVLEYNSAVEIVLQATSLVVAIDHPIHLHGHSFYVVGWGLGNFDKDKDPLHYNLVDPPLVNTIAVPKNGWTALRFRANNPGVWFMHCHIERHLTWGMNMAFVVKDGFLPDEKLLPPPPSMPPC